MKKKKEHSKLWTINLKGNLGNFGTITPKNPRSRTSDILKQKKNYSTT